MILRTERTVYIGGGGVYRCIGIRGKGITGGRGACIVSTTPSFKCIHKMYNTTICTHCIPYQA